MNAVHLVGNLVADAELRYTREGKPVMNFTIAYNERWKEDSAVFIDCVYWTNPEKLNEYMTKGTKIGVSGKLNQREWEKDGQKRRVHEIVVFQIDLLGSKRE